LTTFIIIIAILVFLYFFFFRKNKDEKSIAENEKVNSPSLIEILNIEVINEAGIFTDDNG